MFLEKWDVIKRKGIAANHPKPPMIAISSFSFCYIVFFVQFSYSSSSIVSAPALCLISRLYNTFRVWRQGSQNRINPPRLVTKQVLAFFLQILHLVNRCNGLGIDLAINPRLVSPVTLLTLSFTPRHKLPVFKWEYLTILQKAVFAQDDKSSWNYD